MKYFLAIITIFALYILCGCSGIPAPQEVVADTIGTVDQTSEVVNNTGMDFKTLVMFAVLAGWAIPSPAEMLTGLGRMLTFIKWW